MFQNCMAQKNGSKCAKPVGRVSEEDAIQEAIRLSLEENDKLQANDEKESEESFEDLYDDDKETTITEEKP